MQIMIVLDYTPPRMENAFGPTLSSNDDAMIMMDRVRRPSCYRALFYVPISMKYELEINLDIFQLGDTGCCCWPLRSADQRVEEGQIIIICMTRRMMSRFVSYYRIAYEK